MCIVNTINGLYYKNLHIEYEYFVYCGIYILYIPYTILTILCFVLKFIIHNILTICTKCYTIYVPHMIICAIFIY